VIGIPNELELGRDQTRMKGGLDAARQTKTVQTLLDRMYGDRTGAHLQLVADEVGMGKTFVALGLAYSVLTAHQNHALGPDFEGCGQKVLVIAPQNAALVQKWQREVGEFVRRCIAREHADEATALFSPIEAARSDTLVEVLQDPRPGVVITNMGVLSGGKRLQHYDLKRRVLLGALFRFWGNRFGREERARLLKGAPEGWPSDAAELGQMDESSANLPFGDTATCVAWLKRTKATEAGCKELDELLELCREIAQPRVQHRDVHFKKVESGLNRLYRRVCFAGLEQPLPLVIVDEAHNWKNGPTAKSNGYGGFEEHIAPITRRLLLLTATPFQLRPDEVLELVRAGEVIRPSGNEDECRSRLQALAELRTDVIGPVLKKAAEKSQSFSDCWARLTPAHTNSLAEIWESQLLSEAREKLSALANAEGVVHETAVDGVIADTVLRVEPVLRDMVREGLWLYTRNQDLAQELGVLVIRHRRKTEHRLVRVGAEYQQPLQQTAKRGDRHLLHAAPGIDVRGEGELPHYLLMRAVTEMKQGKGRSSLGAALTGCYSTLLHSDESKRLDKQLTPGSRGAMYFELLRNMVTEENDAAHPKLAALTEQVLDSWRRGDKTLVFCFRTHTARRLATILGELVNDELEARLKDLGLGQEGLRRVRSRLTTRDDVLITLLLDRVLWSLCWAARSSDVPLPALTADELRLRDEELPMLASLALRANVDLRAPSPDRVFIHRATEHILAGRLLKEKTLTGPLFRQLCGKIAEETWVTHPYGELLLSDEPAVEGESADSAVEEDGTALERGGINEIYDLGAMASETEVAELAKDLEKRRRVAKDVSILDSYAEGPNFLLGKNPAEGLVGDARAAGAMKALHGHLFRVTRVGREFAWYERMIAMKALRRTVLAPSLLVRILPANAEREEHGWADTMVEGFFRGSEERQESLAERLAVFLEDFQAATGPTTKADSSRAAINDATRSRGRAVVLVDGSTDQTSRGRTFVGFNTPLLPDILVCTSVGAEGIDLHRHCRNVVHYDLAWNPAVLEQRTGRVDRIGSKAQRDRLRAAEDPQAPFLEVGVPFLAGTYDERMFEELRTRAQIFEVLTGGDISAGNVEGHDDVENAEGDEAGGLSVPVLPNAMVEDLRVKLHVWEPQM